MYRDLMAKAGADVLRHLGEPVETPAGEVTALVDEVDEDVRLRRTGSSSSDHGLETDMRPLRLVVAAADEDSMPPGSVVVVRGGEYEALDPRPRGYGMAEVPLVVAQASDPDGTAWR